jgi:NADPH2:quinone reductase
MKALVSKAFKNTDELEVTEFTLPDIGEDDVIINVAACGLNFPDLLILEEKYQFKPELPYSPGGEVTGVVSRVGANVRNFYLGQRVFAIERWGGLAEKMLIKQDRLFHLPDEIDMVSGASLLYNMSTALYALKNRGKAKQGETILILGAAGGVGLAAVQLAKAMDLTVLAAAGGKAKIDLCKSFGADYTIDYHIENIKDKVNEITGKQGVNLVLDAVGEQYADLAVRSLAWGGRYLVVGFASGVIPKIPLNLVLLKGAEIRGVFWGKFSREQPLKQEENIEQIFEYYRLNKIKSYVGETYKLEDSKRALVGFKERKVNGKMVVICNETLLEKDNKQVRPRERQEKFIFHSKQHVLESAGKELGESRWLQITQQVIDDFADATGDQQWIHVNPERAAKSTVGSTIAHGFLTVSLAPKFLEEIYEMPFAKMGINYGVDKLRFLTPVKVNSQIKMRARLLQAEAVKNDGVKLRTELSFFVKGEEKQVCVAELLSIVY